MDQRCKRKDMTIFDSIVAIKIVSLPLGTR